MDPDDFQMRDRYHRANPDESRLETNGVKEVTFIMSITYAAEMKKPASKYTLRNQTCPLNLDEPQDTMKAQFSIRISHALNPQLLSHEDYKVSWLIPCVLSKPVLSLLNKKDFNVLVK
ncbi:uncharacterized protein BJ212DRAFT_1487079 [Suillus subaureus]|uniref:Uncharacterized protein n=1 Tax=Suillus subaureus TaxID=48587 RepID=A0A9P7DUC1_9AGAM|nr:uncharacterized protein BJ212DRAFT_1487079 [Suillus subaureus]KAG1803289.1 hypothetical protein BJ212DRAFT_1487079 [Suillus subaureus]